MPWPALQRLVNLNTRELTIIAGAPGSGKSTFAVNFAVKADLPVLYLTQDSPASVFSRMAALILNEPTEAIKKKQQQGGLVRQSLVDAVNKRMPKHLIVAPGRRDLGDIDRHIIATTEWLGAPPHVVVIDNLIDLDMEGNHHQETGFYAKALTGLKALANTRDVNIMALHHVLKSGDKGLGTMKLTMGDLLHGGEREARHVLGVYHNHDATEMRIQILKAQDGPADPQGELEVILAWQPEYGSLVGR